MSVPTVAHVVSDPADARALVLASGGLDSTVLLYWLQHHAVECEIAFLNYGQHACDTELATLRDVVPREYAQTIHVLSVADVLRDSPSRLIEPADLWEARLTAEALLVPYRNLFLLTTAVTFAAARGLGAVYTAFINSNVAREIDATHAYLNGLRALYAEVGSVRVHMPFRELAKADVARLGVTLGAPIAATFSCQAHPCQHCGACPNCVDRLEALRAVRSS